MSEDSRPAVGSGESLRLTVLGISLASRIDGARKNPKSPACALGGQRSYTSKANFLYLAGDGRAIVFARATKLFGMTCSTKSFGLSTCKNFKADTYDSKSFRKAAQK